MFEQDLYRFEAPPAEPGPGDLFYHYEVKSWNFGPRLYKIIGLSAIANLVLVAVVLSQDSLLTRRGCDSPFVGHVCEVLDTVYVASTIFGTEREYADVAYEKTELADADITYIDVSNVDPPFDYPGGYFELANPEMAYNQSTDGTFSNYDGSIPGFPVNPTITPSSPLINTPAITPKYNPKAVTGTVPDSPFSLGGDESNSNSSPVISKKDRKGGRINGANTNSQTAANTDPSNPTLDPNANKTEDDASADQNGIFLNKRPLKDKATETLAKIDQGAVKLDKTFRVVITGTLGLAKDGKTIVLKNPKIAPLDKNFPADPTLTKLAQEWIVAVGDAGWYGYLGVMDEKKGVGRKVVITIEQNDTTFVANLKAEQPSPERANTTASALYNMMTLGALAAKGDELTFLKSTKTASDGSFLVVNFEMPKPQVQEMIQRKLAESKEKQAQPNSTAVVGPQNNSAAK